MPLIPQDILAYLGLLVPAVSAFVVAFVFLKIFRSVINQTIGRINSMMALRIQRAGSLIVWTVAIVFILSQFGLDVMILLMIFGLSGLAVVLAMKETLSNALMEYFLISNRPFNLGDWIRVGEYYGRVVAINSLNTVLVTPENERVVIPNSLFSKEVVVNQTTEEGIRISIPVTVDRKRDLLEVERKLLTVSQDIKKELIPSRPPTVIIKDIGKDLVKLELRLWILNPAKKDAIMSEVMKRIKGQLDSTKK
ncbi:MAG: mechanosensitive ion channel family protein [Candidatus Bathyarchaeota archaeon]|nr:mechanosensitive ion channel family protein [Candidatus Bathyarchaeota archaeon]